MVAAGSAQASFVIATTIPISTNTTIAICIQIQVGDMAQTAYPGGSGSALRDGP
jgi:hypothetical protein